MITPAAHNRRTGTLPERSARIAGSSWATGGFSRLLMFLLLLALSGAGCVSKSSANRKAAAAYEAGRRDAMEAAERKLHPTVTLVGDVRLHSVPWTEELTLSAALDAAQYTGARDPRSICVMREGQRMPIDVRRFLKGLMGDPPLRPEDVIEVHR